MSKEIIVGSAYGMPVAVGQTESAHLLQLARDIFPTSGLTFEIYVPKAEAESQRVGFARRIAQLEAQLAREWRSSHFKKVEEPAATTFEPLQFVTHKPTGRKVRIDEIKDGCAIVSQPFESADTGRLKQSVRVRVVDLAPLAA